MGPEKICIFHPKSVAYQRISEGRGRGLSYSKGSRKGGGGGNSTVPQKDVSLVFHGLHEKSSSHAKRKNYVSTYIFVHQRSEAERSVFWPNNIHRSIHSFTQSSQPSQSMETYQTCMASASPGCVTTSSRRSLARSRYFCRIAVSESSSSSRCRWYCFFLAERR